MSNENNEHEKSSNPHDDFSEALANVGAIVAGGVAGSASSSAGPLATGIVSLVAFQEAKEALLPIAEEVVEAISDVIEVGSPEVDLTLDVIDEISCLPNVDNEVCAEGESNSSCQDDDGLT